MNKITIIIFLTLNLCSGQKLEIESELFKDIIVQDRDSIIYSKESYGWEKIKERLNRKEYSDYNLNTSNTITLTESEHAYILSEIAANENKIWAANLFTNSENVSENEIDSYLEKRNKPFKLEVEKSREIIDTSAVIKTKNKHYFVYSFSKPIFFRNGKFCLFAYRTKTGKNSSDYNQIAFYRKRNGKWIEWLEIYNSMR